MSWTACECGTLIDTDDAPHLYDEAAEKWQCEACEAEPEQEQTMKKEFEMSQAQLDTLLEACKPVPLVMLQCGEPSSPQENANRAWGALGREMGFDHMTVESSPRGQRFFSATPTEQPADA